MRGSRCGQFDGQGRVHRPDLDSNNFADAILQELGLETNGNLVLYVECVPELFCAHCEGLFWTLSRLAGTV